MDLPEFGHKYQRAVLHSLIHENVNYSGDICKCEWLEHLIREQSPLSAGCRTLPKFEKTNSKTLMYFANITAVIMV